MGFRRPTVNIGPRGIRRRILLGAAVLFGALGAFVWMLVSEVDSLWRWSLLLPLFGGILCILEARSSTCVVLAALGAWDLGCGTQKVPDSGLEKDLRMRAIKIIGGSFVAALVATALLVEVPWPGKDTVGAVPQPMAVDSSGP
ncbi:MAG TPA: hypothetical protein PKO15_06150 [Fibrobacteria bacterium]|nr:hypothetical protein [Fibrobacteria bacterium]HOX50253.1 hypothetical protein [Fibrobacteria bacterium]